MTRRDWLGAGIAAPALVAKAAPEKPCPVEVKRTKTAAIVTVYRYNSHADVLVGRLLSGYSVDAKWAPSHTQVVSLHAAQVPANTDMSRNLAARNGFKLYPSIREALTFGGKSLAVNGVVFIGEHGDYPTNELGQILYPRYELFSQILDVYEESGRSVPTFFDKHFSYSWEKADAIYRRSKKIGFPFMAGSSIPLTIRKPALDPPLETPITEAFTIGYGPADAYGFHTLEGLQCMVERRTGRRNRYRIGPMDRRSGYLGVARQRAGRVVEAAAGRGDRMQPSLQVRGDRSASQRACSIRAELSRRIEGGSLGAHS